MSSMHHQIRDFVEFGRLAIDDDESRAIALGHQRKSRRRPYHQRRADDEKQVALRLNSSERAIAAAGIACPNDTVAVLI